LESLYDYSEATWSSDKTNIANVYYDYITDTATVTAYSDGTATITAKVGTVKATCAVTVSSSGSTEPGTGGNSNVGAAWLWRDVNYEYGIPYTRIAGSEQFKTVRVSFPYGDPFNDVASSLYVGNGYRVILCEDRSYRGRQMWFTSDVPSLIPYNFNDKVSSYIVLKISDEPTLPTLYEDEAFQGSSVSLVKGEYNNLRDYGFNDKMSAIIVPKGYQVTLYEHKNFSGTSHTVIGPTFIPYWNGFNDECSSYKVTTTSAVYGYNEYIGIPSSSQPPSEWSRDGELSVFVEEEYPDEEEHPDVMLD
jgi:hypothetical protein